MTQDCTISDMLSIISQNLKKSSHHNHAPFRYSLSSIGWDYDQPAHQIWSLYVHTVWRYEKSGKM